jgi:hypothetical protein
MNHMIYNMAELNQFQRSRDRLHEILCYLMTRRTVDEQTDSYIRILETSIQHLEHKIEEFKNTGQIKTYQDVPNNNFN